MSFFDGRPSDTAEVLQTSVPMRASSSPSISKVDDVCSEDIDVLRGLIALDNGYRRDTVSLTASENYPSVVVRAAHAALHGGFYHFAPPYKSQAGEWSFPDAGAVAGMADKLNALGAALFESQSFDWRPNGGSAAEQAIMLGACERGDGIVHFAHRNGGHFALEELAKKVGIKVFHIPVIERSQMIDVEALALLVRDHPEIKLVMLDQSFKLRWQPLFEIRRALPETVTISYDCSHDGGLIAGGVFPQPLMQGADIVHGNTHKTIAGPQKGFIAFRHSGHRLLKPVSDWIAPHLQSNCHAECIAPMYIAFLELAQFGRDYAQATIDNAKAFAVALRDEGFNVAGEAFGYTETHQVHVVLGDADKALSVATQQLPSAGIRANNIEIPGTNGAFGLRLGTQAMTRRGFGPEQFQELSKLMAAVLLKGAPGESIRFDVLNLLDHHSIFPLRYSYDEWLSKMPLQQLLMEVLQ